MILKALFRRHGWLCRTAVVALVAGVLLTWLSTRHELTVEFSAQAVEGALSPELFYTAPGEAFSAEKRVVMELTEDSSRMSWKAQIRSRAVIRQLRLDPMSAPGEFRLNQVVVRGQTNNWSLEGTQLLDSALRTQQLSAATSDGVLFSAAGDDPQLELHLPEGLSSPSPGYLFQSLIRHGGLSLAIWLALEFMVQLVHRHHVAARRHWARFDRFAIRIGGSQSFPLSGASLSVLLSFALGALLFTALGLNQSSIGRWNHMFPDAGQAKGALLGQARAIRSDEWNTQTPWTLNGVQRGMDLTNSNIGGAQSALVVATPVWHPTLIAQPKFWGFLALDLERGFAWLWAYRLFGLLASSFALLLILTRGNALISLTGSLWVVGSSFVQWWFSAHVPEILIGFSLSVVGTVVLAQASTLAGMAAGAGLLSLSLVNLILHVYPPFLVPLAFLAATVLLALAAQPDRWRSFTDRLPLRLGIGLLGMAVAAILVFLWANDARATIDQMLQTIYPGQRRGIGGTLAWWKILYGPFESWRIGEQTLPMMPTNASEASSFWLLFPVAFLAWLPLRKHCSHDRVWMYLVGYCVFLILWMSAPLPAVVRDLIAHLGWSRATAPRAVLGLGITSILVVVVLAAQIARSPQTIPRWLPLAGAMLTTTVVVGVAVLLKPIDPLFITRWRTAGAALVSALLVWSVLGARPWAMLLAVLALSFPAWTVNPLQLGLDPVLKKPVLVKAANQSQTPSATWAVVGSFIFSQGLKTHGLNVLTGSNYVPPLHWLRLLDPSGTQAETWNRYAHIELVSEPDLTQPEFRPIFLDRYEIGLNICSEGFQKLEVTHLAYTVPVPEADLQCLDELKTDPDSGVRLFTTRSSAKRTP